MKYKRKTLLNMDAIEVYELVLSRCIPRFPDGFWIGKEGKSKALLLTKYLLEEKLQWNNKKFWVNVTAKDFSANKLDSALRVFDYSPYKILNELYPNQIKPWEMKMSPMDTWSADSGTEATKWLIEEVLNWSDQDIKDSLRYDTFLEYGLSGMLRMLYQDSPYNALNSAYPNKFKPWDLKQSPKIWSERSERVCAIKWFIEEFLNISVQRDLDTYVGITVEDVYTCGLGGVLRYYNDSLYLAIEDAYPGVFKPWLIGKVPFGYWNKDTVIDAVNWLIKSKLKLEDINLLRKKDFIDNRLSTILVSTSEYNIKKIIKEHYPNYNFTNWNVNSD